MINGIAAQDEVARLRKLCSGPSADKADLANNLGCVLLVCGDNQEACDWLQRAVQLDATQWEFHRNLAESYLRMGNANEALLSLRNALVAAPTNMDALLPLLSALLNANKPADAANVLDGYLISVRLNIESGVAIRNCLNAHSAHIGDSPSLLLVWSKLEAQLGMPQAAEKILDRVLEVDPGHVDAWRERGFKKAANGELEEALVCMQNVARISPTDWAARNDAGCFLRTMGRTIEARDWMQNAVLACPERATLHANLALVNFELNDYAACERHLNDALALEVHNPEALHTRAMWLSATGRHREAVGVELQALEVKPDYPAARLGLALEYLTLGRLREGFAGYESRWVGSDRAEQHRQPTMGRPQWHGQAMLPGACIAILAEQGFGDQLQFSRFVPLLLNHFHRVVWKASPELLSLFQSSYGSERLQVVIEIDANLARSVDVELPLLSLPLVLKIDLEHLPGEHARLRPPAHALKRWSMRFDGVQGLKVGVVWQGRPTLSKNALRNCPVSLFQRLAIPGVQLVSLQRDADFVEPTKVLDWGRECADFADTAALISMLDVVIAVDTAVAHLAASLSVEVWLLNRVGSEWRWMSDREDSPWYPTVRIFNQTQFNDWAPTVERVKVALHARLHEFVSGEPINR